MVQVGEIYHPLRWEVADALRFLQDLPRMGPPASWCACRPSGATRPARPMVPLRWAARLRAAWV